MGLFRRSRTATAAPAGIVATGGSPAPSHHAPPGDEPPTAEPPTERAPDHDAPLEDAPKTLADIPELIRELEALGHDIRYSDQLGATAVPERLSVVAFRILEAGTAIIVRRFPDGQQLHARVRTDEDELLVSIQSTGLDGLGQQGLVPESDREPWRRRIEAIGGRLTLRRTPSGNWIGVVRLPMTGWDDPAPPAG